MEFVLVLAVLAVVVFVVTAPLRRGEHLAQLERKDVDAASEAAALEAAREAKYREIREAELDHQTGKLSDADFDAIDRALRAEAIEILKALDVSGEGGGGARRGGAYGGARVGESAGVSGGGRGTRAGRGAAVGQGGEPGADGAGDDRPSGGE